MTKAELVARVAKTRGLGRGATKKLVAQIIDATFNELGSYFVRARSSRKNPAKFTYPGFGTFTKKRREGRIGRNPRNGEPIEIPAATTITFTPSQTLRSLLNPPKGQ
jgi:nucleoid DNA-binding protein